MLSFSAAPGVLALRILLHSLLRAQLVNIQPVTLIEVTFLLHRWLLVDSLSPPRHTQKVVLPFVCSRGQGCRKCCHLAAPFPEDLGACLQPQTGQRPSLESGDLVFPQSPSEWPVLVSGLDGDRAEVTPSGGDPLLPEKEAEVVPQCPPRCVHVDTGPRWGVSK